MPHILLVLAVLAVRATPDVEAVLTAPKVEKAMQIVDESKAWSIEELITLTERVLYDCKGAVVSSSTHRHVSDVPNRKYRP